MGDRQTSPINTRRFRKTGADYTCLQYSLPLPPEPPNFIPHLYSEIMKYVTRILVCVIAVSKSQEFLLKVRRLFMVALWNRADHNIFMLWFVLLSSSSSSSSFSSPKLSRRRLYVCHTSATPFTK